jgi:uncharacterized OB-fold protein
MTAREVPEPTDISRPFWDATRDGVLLLQWCAACRRPVHYPRSVCPFCGGVDLGWQPMSGAGTVYAHAWHPGDGDGYSVALIDLTEGARMLSSVVGVGPADVAVGQAVELDWEPLSDGRRLPVFRPAAPPREETA